MIRLISFAVVTSSIAFSQGVAPVQVKVVTGVPFSAQVMTETIQVLADGNHIVHKSTAFIARDSEGRVRREQKLPDGTSVVFIQDPVAAVNYAVEGASRSVRKFTIPKAEKINTIDEKVQPAHKTNLKSESVGAQVIEGFLVEGTRLTKTILAGQAGNEQPLEVTSEAWYSPDLETILMNRNVDPRSGETVYKLSEIKRDEPDHSLFEVPADYTIRDQVTARPDRGGVEATQAR